jgi:valyl-tRNA synthetase
MLYRAEHPIEWCIRCGSAISREQTEEKEQDTLLNYINFKVIEDESGKASKIEIATTRPELLHAAVAIAVNPKDKRYSKLIGKTAEVPIFGNRIQIIGDDLVKIEYGTGAEMICTFGDKRDINVYYKNKLKLIQAMDVNGALINAKDFDGLHISKAREKILEELNKLKLVVKQEKIKNMGKVHDRCSTPIELISTTQWFIKIKEYANEIKQSAKQIEWIPSFTRQRLDDWANFIEWDWAITRNRVFGTPMPFWYCEKCNFIVPPKKEDLPLDSNIKKPYEIKCPQCGGQIIGTKETLDGWVDTSITPMIIAGWPDDPAFFKRAFPSSMRLQGTDIIRTWGFYTIFRTWALTGDKPWETALVHGMILGTDGREMHKSLGNGVYPDNLSPKYSADAIRLWVATSGGIGKDRPFSYAEMDYAKSFMIKLYNTANFVNGVVSKNTVPTKEPHNDFNIFDLWIINRMNEVVKSATEGYDKLLLYEALTPVINFYWHEFADYYIENVKHRVYSTDKSMEASKSAALFTLKYVLDCSLRIFAPAIPFMSEEINSMFEKGSIFEKEFPKYVERKQPTSYIINGFVFTSSILQVDTESIGALLNNIISEVRKAKAKDKLALNHEITSININVPGEYYSAIDSSKEELKQILKSKEILVKKEKEFSVSIKV